jgi:hypothetical protein
VLLDHEIHPERSYRLPDGRLMPDSIFVVTEAAKQRLRSGYMCCNCLGQFESAFPLACPDCGFPVAKEQGMLLMHQMYEDYGLVTPGIPLAREREEMARALHVPRPAMHVPKGFPKKKR